MGEKIFCIHGGLSPEMRSMKQIENIKRPCEVPEYGMLCDFLWVSALLATRNAAPFFFFSPSLTPPPPPTSGKKNKADPSNDVVTWAESDRGVSYIFGKKVVENFMETHKMDLVVRAHQVVAKGYEFFARRKMVTVFSAPNYMGEFDNSGAVLSVDEDLLCSFQILQGRGAAKMNVGHPSTSQQQGKAASTAAQQEVDKKKRRT